MLRSAIIGLVSAATLAVAAPAMAQAPAAPAAVANDYAKPEAWLCWPGRKDACAGDNTTTVVAAGGKTTRETWKADPKAPIDCFYVYPTVSTDPGVLSDMAPNLEERRVVEQQLSRFAAKCRVYAPMYRQFTLTALRAMVAGTPLPGAAAVRPATPYEDVKAAWDRYLAHENRGRGVVLIGHSQGSGLLAQLIALEIDGKPAQQRLVSAMLLGTNLPVAAGKDTGQFKQIPLCKAASQTGCVIAYASFRDTIPPPANSRFGKVSGANAAGMEAACANPAALGGGKGALKAYLSNGAMIADTSKPPPAWVKDGPAVTTPFVSVPGLLSAECVRKNGFSYLEVHVAADPADARTDDISGDVVSNGQLLADWGLHLIDVNLAMGNLVDIVGEQAKAWRAKTR